MGNSNSFVLLLLIFSTQCNAWGWFSSQTASPPTHEASQENSISEFSMNHLGNDKGMKLLENARTKLSETNTCWQNAYRQLLAGCSDILADHEKRSRFAWHLSDCFQRDSGRPPFPLCDTKSPMVRCLQKLDDNEHKVYLEFSLETNSICYQLQSHSFKNNMERLVNDLKDSADYTERKLDEIHDTASLLVESSDKIKDKLRGIDEEVQTAARVAREVNDNVEDLSRNTKEIHRQSVEIGESQAVLRRGQELMNENVKEGVKMLQDSYVSLGREVEVLKAEAVEIEGQIEKVSETMSLRMQNLQDSANEIESKAGRSLDKQKELLDGQSNALKGMQILTEFQSEALQESRGTLERLVEYSHRQQEELVRRQEQLKDVHEKLVDNSNSILSAQAAFESKQANMFVALEKIFAIHDAMLNESRTLKALFLYSLSIFVIYMFTSTKQTYPVRAKLYVGLCVTFFVEVMLLRIVSNSDMRSRSINLGRLIYLIVSSAQFMHAIYKYRDYEVINHEMILKLVDKVNEMQRNSDYFDEEDNQICWSEWIESESLEEEDPLEDPDFVLPEIADSPLSSSLTRKYDLRGR